MTTAWLGQRVSVEYYEENKDKNPCKPFHGARLVDRVHPVPHPGNLPEACVATGVGMWNDKIYHFLPEKQPSSGGDELQSEFFVSYKDFPEVVGKIYAL